MDKWLELGQSTHLSKLSNDTEVDTHCLSKDKEERLVDLKTAWFVGSAEYTLILVLEGKVGKIIPDLKWSFSKEIAHYKFSLLFFWA